MEKETRTLAELVWTEQALLELLGINRATLDKLRLVKGLPYIRLTNRNRVYLADDILGWLTTYRREPAD